MKEQSSITRPKIILCPVCDEKEIVDEGTTGKASHKCGKCGRFIEYDYNLMTAKVIEPIKGVGRRMNATT